MLSFLCAMTLALAAEPVRVGSKAMTESVILAEIAGQLAGEYQHRRELGGTQIVWKALLAGEIDVAPEYTGTLRRDILKDADVPTEDRLREHLRKLGIGMTRSVGFENNYAIGVSRRLGLERISDLAARPELRLGFSQEFLDRPEGWKSLRVTYDLPHTDVRSVEHELGYPAIAKGHIDAMDLYTTDAEIAAYDLVALEDDRRHFPSYQAVYLYRLGLRPEYVKRLETVRINAAEMVEMNRKAKVDGLSEVAVASDFVRAPRIEEPTWLSNVWARFEEHLFLVGISLFAGLVVAVPLGVMSARLPRLGQVILSLSGIVQTIPSLALLVFMIPVLGIGPRPAIVALFLYSLLPIVRNTYTGLRDIPKGIHGSAEALGLPSWTRLRLIELPIASRAILAGIKTSAVVNVGTATLGALVGAGGFGQPILVGIRRDDMTLILQGAVPAAVLAIAVQLVFDLVENRLVPRGLR